MPDQMNTSALLRIEADCVSHSQSRVMVRDLTGIIDEPVERGGTNEGFSPTETALSALVGCTNVIAHKCANRLGVDLGHLHITAKGRLNRLGVTLQEEIDVPFERIDLVVVSSGDLTQDELDRVASDVSKFCPLSKLFGCAGTIIKEDWRLSN